MSEAEKAVHSGGLPYAFGAYLLWGFFPIYFMFLKGIAAGEILAHRSIWSVPVVMVILLLRGQWQEFRSAWSSPRALGTMLLSAIFIAINWLFYVAAIVEGHVLATSIGYYLNPLVNVLLGRIFLKERLTRLQAVAVAVAMIGVAILMFEAIDTLWISLILAFSFGSYGLVRKMAPLGSVPGLAVEVTILAPIALTAAVVFAQGRAEALPMQSEALLAISGFLTVIPLLLFATAARKMSYTALGFVQYLAPSIVFLLGVFLFHEPLDWAKLACFGLIWTAIAIFSWDALRRMRA